MATIYAGFYYKGRIKPYTRMTQKSKYVDPAAIAYMASQRSMGYAMNLQRLAFIEKGQPIRLVVEFNWIDHRCDLSNLLKAVEDAANKTLWADDCWVDEILVRRRPKFDDEKHDMTYVYYCTIDPDDWAVRWIGKISTAIEMLGQVRAKAKGLPRWARLTGEK